MCYQGLGETVPVIWHVISKSASMALVVLEQYHVQLSRESHTSLILKRLQGPRDLIFDGVLLSRLQSICIQKF